MHKKQLVAVDVVENYYSPILRTPHQVAHAVARSYIKNYALVASVGRSQAVIGSETVDSALIPSPDMRWGDWNITRVNVDARSQLLYITFT